MDAAKCLIGTAAIQKALKKIPWVPYLGQVVDMFTTHYGSILTTSMIDRAHSTNRPPKFGMLTKRVVIAFNDMTVESFFLGELADLSRDELAVRILEQSPSPPVPLLDTVTVHGDGPPISSVAAGAGDTYLEWDGEMTNYKGALPVPYLWRRKLWGRLLIWKYVPLSDSKKKNSCVLTDYLAGRESRPTPIPTFKSLAGSVKAQMRAIHTQFISSLKNEMEKYLVKSETSVPLRQDWDSWVGCPSTDPQYGWRIVTVLIRAAANSDLNVKTVTEEFFVAYPTVYSVLRDNDNAFKLLARKTQHCFSQSQHVFRTMKMIALEYALRVGILDSILKHMAEHGIPDDFPEMDIKSVTARDLVYKLLGAPVSRSERQTPPAQLPKLLLARLKSYESNNWMLATLHDSTTIFRYLTHLPGIGQKAAAIASWYVYSVYTVLATDRHVHRYLIAFAIVNRYSTPHHAALQGSELFDKSMYIVVNEVVGGFVQILASWNVKAETSAPPTTPSKLNHHQLELLHSVINHAKDAHMENHLYTFLGCLGLTNLLRREKFLPMRTWDDHAW